MALVLTGLGKEADKKTVNNTLFSSQPRDKKSLFVEQMDGITVMLRTKYKSYLQAIVEKLVNNILGDTFASQMQRLQGNLLQEKDLEPPRSVIEARSILCRDTANATCFYV
ncbi:hypothetical protein CCACVL1_10258 [Corchorus capsularis]|uniref:Uncharacterized protein n=1 Tax=Corchorus capsularis TaxID=210143 RepID=A0A1R3IRX1_COCAP|nr:hypothetical protein CCACVL1_10258 [Corchorus capsularis]